jgi:hypothetical protein
MLIVEVFYYVKILGSTQNSIMFQDLLRSFRGADKMQCVSLWFAEHCMRVFVVE